MKNINKCWLCTKTFEDEIQHFLDIHGTYCVGHDHEGGCDIRCLDQCDLCYGKPCVCEEIKNWKPVQAYYMWFPKEGKMIFLNDLPIHPKTKRMWDQAVPL